MKLRRGQAHVWTLPVEAIDDVRIERLCSVLSGEETARVERIQDARNRREYRAAHILNRLMLSNFSDRAAADWRFVIARHGRPELVEALNPCGIRFNLSHARGMVVCALTQRDDIGVDVECLERQSRFTDIAKRKFAPSETAFLEKACDDDRRQVFFSFWTLKESYIKAIGKGLVEPLDGFSFELDPLSISFLNGNGDSDCWSLDLFQPSPAHLCALSVAHPAGATSVISRRLLTWDDLMKMADR